MTRDEVLRRAKECVCGERVQDYGDPEDNFRLIADLWNSYLGAREHVDIQTGIATTIDSRDVAIMMALLKVARIATGTGTEDCYVDLAGYAACAAEAYSKKPSFDDVLTRQAECC